MPARNSGCDKKKFGGDDTSVGQGDHGRINPMILKRPQDISHNHGDGVLVSLTFVRRDDQ